jgi:Tetracyclin repressor-like, C-terminal domain
MASFEPLKHTPTGSRCCSTQPSSFLGYADRLVELMRDDGFSVADALRAHVSVLSFALGSVFLQRSLTVASGDDPLAKRLSLLQQVLARAPHGRYPSLASVASALDRWSFDDTFESGVKALLAGIESQKAPRRGATKRRQARSGGPRGTLTGDR